MSYILDNGDVIYGTESLGFYQIIEIDHKNITYNLPDKREYAIQECADKLGVIVQPYVHVPTNSEITFENGGIVETQQVNDQIANACNGNMFIKNGKVYLSEIETEDLYEAIQVNGKPLPTTKTEIKKLFQDLFNITLSEV